MEHQGILLPHGINTMRFIYLQLLELARECNCTIQSGMVSTNDFLELENQLEKLLYESHAAYSPPIRKPRMSDFKEIKNLASGDFGSVELVRHKKTGQSFAMKVVYWESVTTHAQVQQLFLVRDILTFAENPFITSMACSFETDKFLGFVVDYVQGPNCESQLGVLKRFPVDMARLYVAEAIIAVHYLHNLGIVHRDLKPANMLISATGHIKLTDFGISKIGPVNMTTERHQGSILDIVKEFTDREITGSPVYIAPEMLLQDGYGKPIDWWALGIILYKFLLGVVPFNGCRLMELFTQVLKHELTWPEGRHNLTNDAKDLITALLKKNPAQRLGTRGAYELGEHRFFQNLDMDNLLSEVPLFIPKLESGDTWSEIDRESEDEEDSAVVECLDEDDENSFTYVAFRFRKAYDKPRPLPSSSQLNLNQGNFQECVESFDDKEVIPHDEGKVEEATERLDDVEYVVSDEDYIEEAAEILDEEKVMVDDEGNDKEVDEILPHATNTVMFIYLQLLELALECDSTVRSGTVSTNKLLVVKNKLKKLLYETLSAFSPPVRKPQISDFKEIQHLASGNSGSVELVRHKKTGQLFAMKVVDRKSLTTPKKVQRLFVERDILTFAENPFITSMACSFETDMYLGFVMDYVEGPNCESQLEVLKHFPVDMARLYVAETIIALNYLHSIGILHGDVKPANMLISATGHIKLTDFGISKIGPVNMTTVRHEESILDIIREFTDREIPGSPVYIAPEVILLEGYGKPIDWWALGIILYEFLLGEVPFDAVDMDKMFLQVLTYELTWPARRHDLTHDAKDLITSLLKKNPAQRLGTRRVHEVKDHPFFRSLNMDNLLSEVPLYIPELECGYTSSAQDQSNTCGKGMESENDNTSKDEEDSPVDEYFDEDDNDEDEEGYISFSYVAFRFRKAYEEKEVLPFNEGYFEEADEILPHATNTVRFIYLQLLQLARECDSTIESGVVSTNDFLELADKLEKLHYETYSTYSPPVRKPRMSDFEELQHIGSGNCGSVELVRHKKTGQFYAMKLVNRKSVTTSTQVQQLFVERDILTFAENPFITSLACSFETDMYLGFVMDHVDGLDCEDALYVVKCFPFHMARLYVAETVMALKYLHSLGIVHRDLKPANMLISTAGHIKLTDFGISKIGPVNMTMERNEGAMLDIVKEFTDREIVGSLVYIAPEVFLQDGYGKPLDWWALGIILYEFLLGKVPYNGHDLKEQLNEMQIKNLTWPVDREYGLTHDTRDLITSLLKKDPAQRLGTRGAHEVRDHPFFEKLDMNNLLSEVLLYTPEFDYGDTCSENESESNEEEESIVDENLDENEENYISFTYVAFRFRQANEEEEVMTSSEKSVKEAAGHLDDEEDEACNEENLEETAESLDDEFNTGHNDGKVEDAAEILDDEEFMTAGEDNVEEAAEMLDDEEDITFDEGNVEEAAEILYHEEHITCREEHTKEATEILDEEESMTAGEDNVEEAAEMLDDEEDITFDEGNVEEAAEILYHEEHITCREEHIKEATEILDEEESMTSRQDNVEAAAVSIDEEESISSSDDNVEEAAEMLDDEEDITFDEGNVEEAAEILYHEEHITCREEHIKEATEILDEEESISSSEDNVEEAAESLDEEQSMTSSEDNVEEAAEILDEEEFMTAGEDDKEAAESLDEEESMTSSEDDVEEAAEILDEEEFMNSRKEKFEEAAKILDDEEDITFDEGNIDEAAESLDEEESMTSSEDNTHEAAGSLDEEEFMTSRKEKFEEAAKILDDEEDITFDEGNIEEAAERLDEEESMTSSEDNAQEAAGSHDEEEFMTSREEKLQSAAEILDDEESMTSSEDNVEEAAESLDEEESMTSSEDNVQEAAEILDEEEFMTAGEDYNKEAAEILDDEEEITFDEGNVEEAGESLDEESMTSSEDNVEEAAESLDEEEFMTSREEHVKKAAEILDEVEFMTSREEHVKKAAEILDEVEFMTSREEHVKKAAAFLVEKDLMTFDEGDV